MDVPPPPELTRRTSRWSSAQKPFKQSLKTGRPSGDTRRSAAGQRGQRPLRTTGGEGPVRYRIANLCESATEDSRSSLVNGGEPSREVTRSVSGPLWRQRHRSSVVHFLPQSSDPERRSPPRGRSPRSTSENGLTSSDRVATRGGVRYSVGLFASKFGDRPLTALSREDGRWGFVSVLPQLSRGYSGNHGGRRGSTGWRPV